MFPVYDVDALLLLAIAHSSKRRPAGLVEIIAAGDLIQGAVCSELDLTEAFHKLSAHGLISEVEGGYVLTPDAQKIMTGKKKADAHERVFAIKDKLTAYIPKEECAPVLVTVEQLGAAVLAHVESKKLPGKNLLVPRPKPVEDSKRPGRRKPLTHRRKY
ncbi:MAG: hypothetical protein WC216_10405 [Gallionella sp.]|jgi:hypothetical protein